MNLFDQNVFILYINIKNENYHLELIKEIKRTNNPKAQYQKYLHLLNIPYT